MKEILKKENRTTLIVSIICFVLIGIVATYTYSFFAVTKTNSAIIAGEAESLGLTVSVNQLAPSPSSNLIPQMDDYITSAIIGRQGSCIDDNGNSVCHTYKISVTNANVKTKVNGTLILDKKNNPNLKWAMYSLDGESVPSLVGDIKKPTDTTIILDEEFTAGETKDFYIVVWVSETGRIQTDKGGYSGVVNFITVNDVSGANAPELTENLIPVMYDESTSKWVKADSTNENSDWYNYSAKKWANAVLVKDYRKQMVNNETNKSVNIDNPLLTSYYGDSCGDTEFSITFTFTTGSSGGNLSFDYIAHFIWDNTLIFKLNNETIYLNGEYIRCEDPENDVDCEVSGSFSRELEPNTKYVLKFGVGIMYYDHDNLTIDNISLPNDLSEGLSVLSTDCSWFDNIELDLYSSYEFDEEEEYYILKDKVFALGNAAIGKYICNNGTENECLEIYQVKSVNENTITSVDSYTIELISNLRESLKNASVGTEIPEDMMLAQYVWIPRYKYKVWNINKVIGVDSYNAQNTGIDIIFEEGTSSTGDVTCTYDFSKTATETVRNEECTGTNGESYYTHPAFTFGNDELTGFWVGKYEISDGVKIVPNKYSLQELTHSTSYSMVKNMQVSNNEYGLTPDLTIADSHMIKNMEWGAVAYLTHSIFGVCYDSLCSDMEASYLDDYVDDLDKYPVGWAVVTGTGGTTTGNNYGIYGMHSGSVEMVMASVSSTAGSYVYRNDIEGFNYSNDTEKYITTYAYGDRYAGQSDANRTRLGDAIGEIFVLDIMENEIYIEEDGYIDNGIYDANEEVGIPNGWNYSYVNISNLLYRGGYGSTGIFSAVLYDGFQLYNTRATLVVYP